jgi:purine-nucleoside phosphorylase
MREFFTLEEIDQVVADIRVRTSQQPKVGLILGSGLGGLAEMVDRPDIIPYANLPFWPASTVQGHVGRLVIGNLMGLSAIVQQGRAHFYEGYSMAEVTLPVRVMQRMGVEFLIVTNAAGAINPDYQPGDIMLIVDHIALVGMTGFNPLRGPNLEAFGPRFPDMSQAYDRELIQLTQRVAAQKNISLRQGIYMAFLAFL